MRPELVHIQFLNFLSSLYIHITLLAWPSSSSFCPIITSIQWPTPVLVFGMHAFSFVFSKFYPFFLSFFLFFHITYMNNMMILLSVFSIIGVCAIVVSCFFSPLSFLEHFFVLRCEIWHICNGSQVLVFTCVLKHLRSYL